MNKETIILILAALLAIAIFLLVKVHTNSNKAFVQAMENNEKHIAYKDSLLAEMWVRDSTLTEVQDLIVYYEEKINYSENRLTTERANIRRIKSKIENKDITYVTQSANENYNWLVHAVSDSTWIKSE